MVQVESNIDRPRVIFIIIITLIIISFGIIVFYVYGAKSQDTQLFLRSDVEYNSNNNSASSGNNSKNDKSNRGQEGYSDGRRQVYNLGNNVYTLGDAKLACKAHGGRLATLEEVINAYKNGADWCNYGWTEGQLALYPTQKESWEKLQKGPKENRGSCGMIGVNGGYFENDKFLFGANCYGDKPKPKGDEVIKRNIDTHDVSKVHEYKSKLSDIKVLPFNANKWSQYQ